MRIAIVGTGISGLVCAHRLAPHHDLTIFEAADRLGGHTNTVRVDLADETHHVDTGFIVHNDRNYPHFVALMDELGVATQPSDMSFSVSDARTGLEYRGTNFDTVFAQRRNVLRPRFLRMLADIVRFNRQARRLVDNADRTDAADVDGAGTDDLDGAEHGGVADDVPGESLAELLTRGHYSTAFVEQFLVPLGSAIWSADPESFTEFPALAYARFMENHGLLALRHTPQWRTIVGGSHRYVEALTTPLTDRIRLSSAVRKVVRLSDGRVEVLSARGPETFDRVVLATHSDQALALLADPSPAEREILGAIRFQPNVATLHTDERFLPRTPRARASWNYHLTAESAQRATLTYWMNNLQALESRHQILVTLNRDDEIDPDRRLHRDEYAHPVFDGPAIAAQRRRPEIQGVRGTYFAGAWWEYGFHEDGVRSALDVCRHLEPR